MWIADKWRDYELLDCGSGERLERWGRQVLVRPDPPAIWESPRRHPGWKQAGGRYLRSKTGGGHWEKAALPESWQLEYGPLTFQVKPMNFKHTGLFPEQAVNWEFVMEKIRTAGRPVSVLNLFAYTGGATVACAKAGASVCHVDAARGMVWKLEENLYGFVKLCAGALSERPLFVLINSYTTGLAPSVLGYLLNLLVADKYGGKCAWDELGLPVTETGLALPCGAAGRWFSE